MLGANCFCSVKICLILVDCLSLGICPVCLHLPALSTQVGAVHRTQAVSQRQSQTRKLSHWVSAVSQQYKVYKYRSKRHSRIISSTCLHCLFHVVLTCEIPNFRRHRQADETSGVHRGARDHLLAGRVCLRTSSKKIEELFDTLFYHPHLPISTHTSGISDSRN